MIITVDKESEGRSTFKTSSSDEYDEEGDMVADL